MFSDMTDKPRSHGRKAIRQTFKPRELMTHTPELAGVWRAQIITLFPDSFPGVLGASLTGKALQEGLWQMDTIDLRRFGDLRHIDCMCYTRQRGWSSSDTCCGQGGVPCALTRGLQKLSM